MQAGRWPPCRKITNLFTTLPWPRDCKEILWSSGQAASACLPYAVEASPVA